FCLRRLAGCLRLFLLCAHRCAVLELADCLIGAADDLLALLQPLSTSKYFSPAIPTFTGRKVTLLFGPTTKTPSTSRFPTCFAGAFLASVSAVSGFTLSSRTVNAIIGIDNTLFLVEVMIFALAET